MEPARVSQTDRGNDATMVERRRVTRLRALSNSLERSVSLNPVGYERAPGNLLADECASAANVEL